MLERQEMMDIRTIAPRVSQADVDNYFSLRSKLRLAKTKEDFLDCCMAYGVQLESNDLSGSPSAQRKMALAEFAKSHFPQSSSVEGHKEKLERVLADTVNYLRTQNSQIVLWAGGSFGKGKVGKTATDLDLCLGIPALADEESRLREYENLIGLKKIGYVFSEAVTPAEDVLPIFESGRGLAEISVITNIGIQVDVNVLGMKDLLAMHAIFPGSIQRTRPTEARQQVSVSFTGEKVGSIPRAADSMYHYTKLDGQVLKGHYPDNIATISELLYDPNGQGAEVQHNVWLALVKAFIFHNNGYIKDASGKTVAVDYSKVPFSAFLRTLWYQNPEDYGSEKLSELESKYNKIIDEVVERYSLSA